MNQDRRSSFTFVLSGSRHVQIIKHTITSRCDKRNKQELVEEKRSRNIAYGDGLGVPDPLTNYYTALEKQHSEAGLSLLNG